MIKFPKIRQFRDVIREVRHRAQFQGVDDENMPIMNRDEVLPSVEYVGTVKMHGSNASVRLQTDDTLVAQSRNRVLSLDNDNAGFARFAFEEVTDGYWLEKLSGIREAASKVADVFGSLEVDPQVTVYGEWCGGSIQRGVALNGLNKMFVVFAVRFGTEEDTVWLGEQVIRSFDAPEQNIYNSFMFENYRTTVDFENPGVVKNDLVELTNAVEDKCPVGFHFGVEGVGEGIVWRPDPLLHPTLNRGQFWFKVKGKKHSDSKVKTLAPIDPEKAKSVNEFVSMVTTDHRLEKGIDFLNENGFEISKKSTGHFLKWVGNDVLDEEADSMEASSIERRDVMKAINEAGKRWFFAYLDAQVGV